MSDLATALAFARRGFAIFPCAPTKQPLTPHGWKDADDDPGQITDWWTKYPDALIGLDLPPGTVVVDLDTYKPGFVRPTNLPKAPSQKTLRGGEHYFYKTSPRGEAQQTTSAEGVDTRVAGKGYVIVYQPDRIPAASKWPDAPMWVYLPQGKSIPESADSVGATAQSSTAGEMGLGTRAQITSALGTLKNENPTWPSSQFFSWLSEPGRVESLDPTRPWTRKDLFTLAREAAEKFDAVEPERVIQTEGFEAPDEPAVGVVQSLSELDRTLPAPMLLNRLDPIESTVLFGPGGVGKGSLATYWAIELARLPQPRKVLILDYENHGGEWARRAYGLSKGADPNVLWVAPYRQELGALWSARMIATLRSLVEAERVDYLLIDSAIMACGGEDPTLPETAGKYDAALQQIGLPSLTLAHVTKLHDPRYPFGSVFWHNLARVTWSMMPRGDMTLLQCQKANNYEKPKAQSVRLDWIDGKLRDVVLADAILHLVDQIKEALEDGPKTASEVTAYINDELSASEAVKSNTVDKTLSRGNVKDGPYARDPATKAYRLTETKVGEV